MVVSRTYSQQEIPLWWVSLMNTTSKQERDLWKLVSKNGYLLRAITEKQDRWKVLDEIWWFKLTKASYARLCSFLRSSTHECLTLLDPWERFWNNFLFSAHLHLLHFDILMLRTNITIVIKSCNNFFPANQARRPLPARKTIELIPTDVSRTIDIFPLTDVPLLKQISSHLVLIVTSKCNILCRSAPRILLKFE